MFESEQDPQSRQEEIARLSEESRRRAELPGRRPPAPLPMDVEATKKKIGKTLGIGAVLVDVIRSGLVGLAGVVFGPACLWRGFSKPINYGLVAGGVFMSGLAIFGLWSAWRDWKVVRAISRA